MMHSAAPWRARWGVIALLVVAVLAQTLGLVHRSAHTAHAPTRMMAHDHGDHQHDDHEHGHFTHQGAHHGMHHASNHSDEAASTWAERLFTEHGDDGAVCVLYDAQATVYGAFIPVVQVFIAQAAIILIAFSQIMSTARAAALFEARGPPAAL